MNEDYTKKAALFFTCMLTTVVLMLLVAGCTGGSVYEVDCSDPFNMCDRADLVERDSV